MLKLIQIITTSSLLLLQSCQFNNQEKVDREEKQRNLKNAASYNTQLGLTYLKQGDRPRAKRKLFTALKQEPRSTEVNTALAYYFEQSGDMEQARSYYLKAITLAPGAGAQLNNYGTFLCRQGDYAQSINYFMKAIHDAQYINTAGAYENAGLCAEAMPDLPKSKAFFKKALEHDPARKQSFYELVKLEEKQGNLKQALELIDQYPQFAQDKATLDYAKNLADKSGDTALQQLYDLKLQQLEQHQGYKQYSDNSGVDNEYNSHNG